MKAEQFRECFSYPLGAKVLFGLRQAEITARSITEQFNSMSGRVEVRCVYEIQLEHGTRVNVLEGDIQLDQ